MLGYFALLLLFLLCFSGSFYWGLREWLRPWDDAPLPIDVEYVRVENYLGASFRAKMQQWLAAAHPNGAVTPDSPVRLRLGPPPGQRLLTLPAGRFESQHEHDELVYCEGDLALAGGSIFHKEIYCRGNFETEASVRLRAVAADGDVILGADNHVERWVDAQRKVFLRSGSVIGSRVSSLESVELERRVSVQSVYAPLIVTPGYHPIPNGAASPELEAAPAMPATPAGTTPALPPYLEGSRCSPLAPDTWLVQGDLNLVSDSRVECNLVVKGSLHSGSDCYFAGDLKAAGVKLGSRNQVLRNLVSEGSLEVGEASFLAQSVVAETNMRLGPGVRVGRPDSPGVVSAGGEVVLEENVAICGKATARRGIRTV